LRKAFQESAIDIFDEGYDDHTGYGILDAVLIFEYLGRFLFCYCFGFVKKKRKEKKRKEKQKVPTQKNPKNRNKNRKQIRNTFGTSANF